MRSSSSRAFRSASSKSIGAADSIFFAPRPFFFAPSTLVFRGCVVAVLRIAEDGIARAVAAFASAFAGVDESLRGDFDRGGPLPFAPALRKGEAVRLAFAGVPVREGGLLGRLIAGLSHEEKKSSEGSPAGVFAPSGELSSAMSATDTSSGNLEFHQLQFCNITSRSNSQSLICRNSSLQLFLILGRRIRGVFYFRVFARKCSRAAVGLEVFGS